MVRPDTILSMKDEKESNEKEPILGEPTSYSKLTEQASLNTDSGSAEQGSKEISGCKIFAGFILAVTGTMLLAFSYGSAQYLGEQIAVLQFTVLRYVSTAILSSVFLIVNRRLPVFSKSDLIPLIVMVIISNLITIVIFRAITLAPLGTLAAISRLVIYNLSTAFGKIFMRDSITSTSTATVIIGMIGSILLIQPWYPAPDQQLSTTDSEVVMVAQIISNVSMVTGVPSNPTATVLSNHVPAFHSGGFGYVHNRTRNYANYLFHMTGEHPWAGILLVCLSGLLIAIEIILQRKYIIHPDIVSFYTSFFAGTVSFALLFIIEYPAWPDLSDERILLAGFTVAIGLGTVAIAKGQLMTSPLCLSIASSLFIILMLIGQYTVLRSTLSGYMNALEIIGIVLIIVGINMKYIVEAIKPCLGQCNFKTKK